MKAIKGCNSNMIRNLYVKPGKTVIFASNIALRANAPKNQKNWSHGGQPNPLKF